MNNPGKPPWFADVDYLKGELEKIALHPECPKPIYNLAADALGWARKHVDRSRSPQATEKKEGD